MDVSFLTSAVHQAQYPPADRPEIAFAGRSNVGKSSLFNTLVNRKNLAKVSATPGRTQTINFFTVGKKFYLVDLPGFGYARVPPRVKASWSAMIETYLRMRSNLKGVVVIIDIRRDPGNEERDLLQWLHQYEKTPILVLTKTDKVSRQQAIVRAKGIGDTLQGVPPSLPFLFSSKTRLGREELWREMVRVMQIEGFQVHRP